MTKQVLIILLFLISGLTACDSNRIYEENIDLENKTWIADSSLTFQFQIKNQERKYNLYYNLRNSVSYPFQNIYVNYTLEDTLGNQISTELVNKDLFHPKTGKPYGDGLGDIFDHRFPLLKSFQFEQAGTYRLKLEQFMRRDSLPEILSVGVRVEDASGQVE
ncbi:gliding motility lipoprotein GldH [Fulvivirga sp. 29W222]|uniref:Gliding motility lipoprotein GldH n=1 Tax=Fulvivirga marina TaxID=2494733 RepID=A0A937KE47_9BACT|nr:gliding motility lipoprotein GldH [Fulvivirga marina]MBL6446853.1 gliding motility lipoprotein GldH [Fulvivirga marina]